MSFGRVVSAGAASVAVAGCVIVAIGMSQAVSGPAAQRSSVPPAVTPTSRPAYLPSTSPAAATLPASTVPARAPSSAASASRAAASAGSSAPAATPRPALLTTRAAATTAGRPAPVRTTAYRPPSSPKPAPQPVSRGQSLPLHYSTGSATKVITVTARSSGSTTATLQAWTKAPGGGWRRYGSGVTAHVGADGLSSHPSESRSATPIGSFTLTQAFGHYSDPGTALPYIHTTPADWWISQPGRLYNTHQRCSSGCSFTRGDPNEHLYYETPYYNYAVVIDYNTRNSATGVRAGAGSAFFLHVTDGAPTAGCVAIGQAKLVSLMRWLTPSAHPRILIGVS
jgi:L,D-peptidoglycan transpeptidase YkuD (ErfK/YbiS/YcfS/YnhG family)